MSQFTYQARNKTGQLVQGQLQAASEARARQLLQSNELMPVRVEETTQGKKWWMKSVFSKRVRMRDLILFSRQLSAMIRAGVPIVQALESVAEQVSRQSFQTVLEQIIRSIEGGDSFSLALSRHPTVFSAFYLGLIRTGESSGQLGQALSSLADYEEQDYIFRRKVITSLTYPALIILTMIAVTIIIFTFVLPQLVELFADASVQLPLPTRLLLALVNFWTAYWYIILILLGSLGLIFRSWIKTPEGRFALSSIVLRIPIIKSLFRKVYLARLTSMLHILFNGNVPVLEALYLVEQAMGNKVYQKIMTSTRQAVKDGSSISSVWENEPFIPPLLTALVHVGEQSGQLNKTFNEANRFFSREVEEFLSNITVLIEPLIVILLGIGVAILVASVFLPIYNLVLTI